MRDRLARLVPGLAAALVLAAVDVIALWPALSGHRVLSPAAVLYDWWPWAAYRPQDLNSYLNPLLGDHAFEFYPWLQHARDAIRAGRLPQWNPDVLSGAPFLANQQTAVFSPFSLPIWTTSLDYGLGLAAFFKLWVAGLGAYALARGLRLRFWSSLVAGLAFGLSPFLIVWLSHPQSSVAPLLPWTILAVERIVAGGRRGLAVAGLALALALALLGGHPGTQLHIALAIVVYGGVRLAVLVATPWHERLLRAALVLVGSLAGAALAAPALLPAALLVPGSAGLAARGGGGAVLPAVVLRTIAFPDWWGRPGDPGATNPGANFNERTLYVGCAVLLLAALGTLGRGRLRRALPFLVLALIGLAVPLGLQPLRSAVVGLPLLRNAEDARLILLWGFGCSMLAALGAERALGGAVARAAPRRALLVALPGVAVGLVGLWIGRNDGLSRDAALWWLGLVLATALALALPARLRGPALALVVAIDMLHFQAGYQPLAPRSRVYALTPPSLAYLQAHAGHDRIAAGRAVLLPDSGMGWGLRDVRGYDPPLPDADYLRLFRLLSPDQPDVSRLAIDQIDARGRRVLDLLDVRYLVRRPGGEAPSMPGFRRVYVARDATIYENRQRVPRATLPGRVHEVAGPREAVAEVARRGFVPGRDAAVEGDGARIGAARGSVRIANDRDERVELLARLRRGGLVVLADRYADGWSVTVDGRRATPLRVDGALRGVVVPAGRHSVVWRYRTPGLRAGLWACAAAMLALVLWLAASALRAVLRREGEGRGAGRTLRHVLPLRRSDRDPAKLGD